MLLYPSNRLVVMHEGEIVETGTPAVLLANKQSLFYSIMHSQ